MRGALRIGAGLLCLWCATGAGADTPRLVAPGLLSSEYGEYHPSHDAARDVLYFMRRTPGRFDYTLYQARRSGGRWSQPEVLPFSGRTRDAAPFIAPDGDTLYFDSRRPAEGLPRGSINLWRVSRGPGGWGEPELLRVPSSEPEASDEAGADEFGPVVTADGDLWFYSFRPPFRDGRHYRGFGPDFSRVEVAAELPDPSAATFVAYLYLSPDGRTAVIEGRSRAGRDTDLFFACRSPDGEWSEPEALPGVNSPQNDGGGALSTDGKSLWFTSDRPTDAPGARGANLYELSTDHLPIPCES